MAETWTEFVGKNPSKFPGEELIGAALKRVIDRRWKNNVAKFIENIWNVDAKTARNFDERGSCSERTLTKAMRAERWALWMAVGEEFFGESYEDFLRGIADEQRAAAERARDRADRLRTLEKETSRLLVALDRTAA